MAPWRIGPQSNDPVPAHSVGSGGTIPGNLLGQFIMKTTISNVYQFRDAFHNAGRSTQFSYEGLELLFNYLEEVDSDYELDVVALCCDYSEDSVATIARDYSIDLNDADPEDDDYADQCQALVIDYLNDNGSVVGVTPSGLIVYVQF